MWETEFPTASAIVADIISIISNKKDLAVNYDDKNIKILSKDEIQGDYYVRLKIKSSSDALVNITDLLSGKNIKISSITENKINEDDTALLFTIRDIGFSSLSFALNELKSLSQVYEIENIIKIENYEA